MNRFTRVAAISLAVGIVAGIVAGLFGEAPSAHAAPAGFTVVTPSIAACDSAAAHRGDLRALTACGAGYVAKWLRHTGASGVVTSTVITPKLSAGLHRSSTTGFVCGYAPLVFGMHHCDRTTYMSRGDSEILRTPAQAIAALVHESGHGLQERAGLDPVLVTLQGPTSPRLFPYEQSSDCWAGAAYRWFVSTGMPHVNVAEATSLFARIARDGDHGHGSPRQRVAAFQLGLKSGSGACNVYFGKRVFPAA